MKNVLLLLTIAVLAFTSCKKDDDEGIGHFDYNKELLYGTWEITDVSGFPWYHERTTATFNPDGTYYGRGYFGTGSGTYKLSGKKITCYVEGKVYMWYEVVSLDDKECTLIANDNSGRIRITCKKRD